MFSHQKHNKLDTKHTERDPLFVNISIIDMHFQRMKTLRCLQLCSETPEPHDKRGRPRASPESSASEHVTLERLVNFRVPQFPQLCLPF